jgi:VWFA-related protein
MISPRNLGRRVTVFAAVLSLIIANFFVVSARSFAQTQGTQPSPPPQQEAPPEAGGPQGSTSPIAVPKKKEEPPPPPKPKVKNPEGLGDYSLQVAVPLVNVPVLVTTHNGEFIPGLQKDNFRITEDGVPQKISNFQQGEAPITAVLLVEFASTNYSFIYDMLNNAYGFAQSLKPQDWVAVISYDMRPEIQQDFTQDKARVVAALNHLRIPGFSETNLFDALYDTLDRLERVQGRKYVILISTGCDSFSKLNYDQILKKIKGTRDITIYPVSVGQALRIYAESRGLTRYLHCTGGMQTESTAQLDFLQADNQMSTFAKMTGGKAYFPRFAGAVREVVGDISNSIRNEYEISYHSTNPKLDGTFRKIKVELVDPQTGGPINMHVNGKPEKKYNIIAREGYTAKREVE